MRQLQLATVGGLASGLILVGMNWLQALITIRAPRSASAEIRVSKLTLETPSLS